MSTDNIKLVQLPSIFSQVQLSGLKEVVDHHLENGHRVEFDSADVDRIDGAAVQFLVAISKFQSSVDNPSQLMKNTNDVVINALDDMGVKDLIVPDSGLQSGEANVA